MQWLSDGQQQRPGQHAHTKVAAKMKVSVTNSTTRRPTHLLHEHAKRRGKREANKQIGHYANMVREFHGNSYIFRN
jgi:hypothetical protein